MPYASRADMEDRYGVDEISQRESMLPAGALDRALADADAEIESYVGGRYTVPLAPVPANVVRLACSIARYHLLGDAVTERSRNDYQDARAFLRDVQAGRAQLESATPLASAAPANTASIETRERIFSGGLQ